MTLEQATSALEHIQAVFDQATLRQDGARVRVELENLNAVYDTLVIRQLEQQLAAAWCVFYAPPAR